MTDEVCLLSCFNVFFLYAKRFLELSECRNYLNDCPFQVHLANLLVILRDFDDAIINGG